MALASNVFPHPGGPYNKTPDTQQVKTRSGHTVCTICLQTLNIESIILGLRKNACFDLSGSKTTFFPMLSTKEKVIYFNYKRVTLSHSP